MHSGANCFYWIYFLGEKTPTWFPSKCHCISRSGLHFSRGGWHMRKAFSHLASAKIYKMDFSVIQKFQSNWMPYNLHLTSEFKRIAPALCFCMYSLIKHSGCVSILDKRMRANEKCASPRLVGEQEEKKKYIDCRFVTAQLCHSRRAKEEKLQQSIHTHEQFSTTH